MMINWRSASVVAIVMVTALATSHAAFAVETPPAPEIDPSMAVAGLGVAAGAAAIIWERLRSRKNKKS